MSERSVKADETFIKRVSDCLRGEPLGAAGAFVIEHSGSMPIFRADQEAFFRLGVTILLYAANARPVKGSSEFRGESFEGVFSAKSRVRTLVLAMDEGLGSRGPVPSTFSL
jgi:hypothetical protein